MQTVSRLRRKRLGVISCGSFGRRACRTEMCCAGYLDQPTSSYTHTDDEHVRGNRLLNRPVSSAAAFPARWLKLVTFEGVSGAALGKQATPYAGYTRLSSHRQSDGVQVDD